MFKACYGQGPIKSDTINWIEGTEAETKEECKRKARDLTANWSDVFIREVK